MSFFEATPVLTSDEVSSGFTKPELAALFALGRGICDVHSLGFTSDTTPAYLLMASMVTVAVPHMHVSV